MDYDKIDTFLQGFPGCTKDFKAEWGWQRYLVGGKMFAATLCPGPEHAPEYAGRSLLTLKCDPAWSEVLRAENSDVLPGFYTNKKHWISVDIHGTVHDELLRELCTHSYHLVFATLTKKLQRAITEAANI